MKSYFIREESGTMKFVILFVIIASAVAYAIALPLPEIDNENDRSAREYQQSQDDYNQAKLVDLNPSLAKVHGLQQQGRTIALEKVGGFAGAPIAEVYSGAQGLYQGYGGWGGIGGFNGFGR